MKTWVRWTHYECEVYVLLHATEWEAWKDMRDNWLDDCDDDCGHEPDTYTTIEEIRDAINYHYADELEYYIGAVEVPVAPEQLTAERVERPDRNSMPTESANALLSSLQQFQESS